VITNSADIQTDSGNIVASTVERPIGLNVIVSHYVIVCSLVPVSEVPGRQHLLSAMSSTVHLCEFVVTPLGPVHFLSTDKPSGIHPRDPAVDSEQFRRDLKMCICLPDIRSISAVTERFERAHGSTF